jgi:ADP-heptose:LPS heptosyltransferase
VRIHPADSLLFLLVKLLKSLDRRGTDLKYFRPEDVKSIMVVSSTAIGDTLLSTPAIRAVRERYPAARITAHFNARNVELFQNNPDIDGIIPYYGGYKKFLKTVREFRRQKFDLALIFHGNEPQATPMAYLAGARFIVKIPMSKEYGFLLSNKDNGFGNPWDHHAIEVRLKTASFVGCREDNRTMVLIEEEEERSPILEYLKGKGIERGKRIVGFQVGAASSYKEWPKERFAELGRRIHAYDPSIAVILTGAKKEKDLCSLVARETGGLVVSTAGELSLRQLRALVKEMDLLVTNDTGTMHMAIALQTRTVSLFCPTNSWGVGPLQDLHLHKVIKKDRPCDPCVSKKCVTPRCMELIIVDEVFEAVKKLLNTRVEHREEQN